MKALAAVLTLLWASGAAAQSTCAPRGTVIGNLQAKYGEMFRGGGLQSAQEIFEVWVSPETGTWTIIRTSAIGISCVMASGTVWRDGEDFLPGVPG